MNIPRCLTLSSVLLLAACGESIPQTTDEQLLSLLGEHREAYGQQLPPSISRSTEECVRLLSGMEDEIVQDIPAEFLGQFKAECRTGLREKLEKEELNTMGMELSHFENRELGERISELAEPSREAAKQATAEARLNEQQAKIDEAREKIAGFLSSMDDRLEGLAQRCTAFTELRQSALDQGIEMPSSVRWFRSVACSDSYPQQVRTQAESVSERLETLEPSTGMLGASMPHFGAANPDRLDEQKEALENKIQELNQLLGE